MKTLAGSNAAATKQVLSFCEEWSNLRRDAADMGTTYDMLAVLERTVRCSELDLGLD
jgi:hypothetical protein